MYKISEADGKVTVTLTGSLYVEVVAKLREDVLQLIDSGKVNIVIDMNSLEYIDSAGLGVLITFQKRVLQRNGGVTVRGLQGVVRELFELTRLDKVFDIEK